MDKVDTMLALLKSWPPRTASWIAKRLEMEDDPEAIAMMLHAGREQGLRCRKQWDNHGWVYLWYTQPKRSGKRWTAFFKESAEA